MDKDGVIWYLGYCHMDSKPGYKVGDKLTKSQTVGLIGNSGVSSGPHLHATASRKLKGVFGVTADKVDLHKLILENIKRSEAKQEDTKDEALVEPSKPQVIYACPHCKKELC
jgi:murein DD-endopeptidase MepM/ murein hydrolase activator NlpD